MNSEMNDFGIPDWSFMDKYTFLNNEDFAQNVIGFIYKITLSNGKSYIGRKKIYSERKKLFGKKKLSEITDKRLKKYEIIKKESDWRTYIGSNKDLIEDVKNGVKVVKREILLTCTTEKQMTFFETKMLFVNDVLNSESYYNDNILGKFFRKDLING